MMMKRHNDGLQQLAIDSNSSSFNNWQIIITWALKVITIEAKSYPAFGLVSLKNSGCHNDMDINTFLKSKNTFRHYFKDIIVLLNSKNKDFSFVELRKLGLIQEQRMFKATNNVNTHKGLIFSFGIIFYVTIYALKNNIPFSKWSSLIKQLVIPLRIDFACFNNNSTGEKLFARYGITGARGLALKGYKIIFDEALPFLKHYQNLYPKLSLKKQSLLLLIFFLSKIEDTTLINKIGYEASVKINKEATNFLTILAKNGWKKFYQLICQNNSRYCQQNVSPGGCADLCVITLFLAQFS